MTRPWIGGTLLVLVVALGFLAACERAVETPEQVVRAAIERHGGSAFDRVAIRWDFRGVPFEVHRDRGLFRYQRTVVDALGQARVEVMENEGTWIEVDGRREAVDAAEARRIESGVNSTVYLGFLPFRLDDPAVRLQDLGMGEVEGVPYRKIQVTFEEEGGGRDWQDRFVYWFRDGDWTLDYLAYWEAVDPPVTRFRRAINQREVGGLLIQDYENFTAADDAVDIADYDRLFEAGELDLVSVIEFEAVRVEPGRLPLRD
jgi:hypothetical protein